MKINSTSDILLFSLNRFNGDLTKNCADISITDNISLNKESFELIGYIVHRGKGLDFGHYVYYIKGIDTWIRANDDTVEGVLPN